MLLFFKQGIWLNDVVSNFLYRPVILGVKMKAMQITKPWVEVRVREVKTKDPGQPRYGERTEADT